MACTNNASSIYRYHTAYTDATNVAYLGSPQVNVSWEPASNLKQSVIDEYDSGDQITTG